MAALCERTISTLRIHWNQEIAKITDEYDYEEHSRDTLCANGRRLCALLLDTEYQDGPKQDDQWSLVYHKISLSTATISVVGGQHFFPHFSKNELCVRDGTNATFWEHALFHWGKRAFETTFFSSDADLCSMQRYLCKIPWEHLSIVHTASGKSLDAIIALYTSFCKHAKRPLGKRLGDALLAPEHKRPKTTAQEPPETAFFEAAQSGGPDSKDWDDIISAHLDALQRESDEMQRKLEEMQRENKKILTAIAARRERSTDNNTL